MVQNEGSAYDMLPGVARPWLTTLGIRSVRSPSAHIALDLSCFFVFSTMGLMSVLFARSKNRMADVAAGLVTGTVAGLVMFAISFGGVITLAEMWNDTANFEYWNTVGAACVDPAVSASNQAQLLQRYPDLKRLAPIPRANALAGKNRYEQAMSLNRGIGFGLFLTLLVVTLMTTTQAIYAAVATRRHPSRLGKVLGYLEMAIPGVVGVGLPLLLVTNLLGLSWSIGIPFWRFSLVSLSAWLAIAGAMDRRPWWARMSAQTLWVWLYFSGYFTT